MERKRIVAALIASAVLSFGLVDRSDAQGAAAGFGNHGGGRRAGQRWRELPPEERQRIKANAARWLQLPPEQRNALRAREVMRRQQIRLEAETALQNSGLKLEDNQRELYERRYMQERRRVERALRLELEEKRQREMAPVVEGLKKEFTEPTGTGPAAVASPSPKK